MCKEFACSALFCPLDPMPPTILKSCLCTLCTIMVDIIWNQQSPVLWSTVRHIQSIFLLSLCIPLPWNRRLGSGELCRTKLVINLLSNWRKWETLHHPRLPTEVHGIFQERWHHFLENSLVGRQWCHTCSSLYYNGKLSFNTWQVKSSMGQEVG